MTMQTIIDELTAINAELIAQTNRANELERIRQIHDAQIADLQKQNKIETVIAIGYALDDLAIPYVFGGESRTGMDCSGFTQFLFGQVNVLLPRTSRDQATRGQSISATDRSQWKRGDLVFFDYSGDGIIDHVGIYLGGDNMLHTNTPATGINIKAVGTPKIVRRLV